MKARALAIGASVLALACAACGSSFSQVKSVATTDFPKTWDQVAAEEPVRDAAEPQKRVDVLELVDGTQIVGVITAQTEGQLVTIVTAAGEQHTVPWARIKHAGAGAPAAEPPRHVTVVLKDGTTVEGTLVRLERGQYVVVAMPDGSEKTISWERVSEVNVQAK